MKSVTSKITDIFPQNGVGVERGWHSGVDNVYNIQGDSGAKLNILGGGSMGHCEKKKVHINMSDSERL
jgi:hypothetical protein